MPEVFYSADLHLDHRKMVFPDPVTGETYRPWSCREEMNEDLIARWNLFVGPKDRAFVLGDASINKSGVPLLGRLNGRITLVMGNHDTFRASDYLGVVEDLKGAVEYKGMILTHVPVHVSQMRRWSHNVHGHLHHKTLRDPRYLCVSLERTNYFPIPHEEVLERLETQRREATPMGRLRKVHADVMSGMHSLLHRF